MELSTSKYTGTVHQAQKPAEKGDLILEQHENPKHHVEQIRLARWTY